MRAHLLFPLPNWPHTLIRRPISVVLRVLALVAAVSCTLAAAPAASARSVTGEYTPAAVLTTDAPAVLTSPEAGAGVRSSDAEPVIIAPLIEAPAPATAVASPVAAPVAAPSAAPSAPDPRRVAIATAIEAARSKLGAPYAYGSAGPYAFDCSGFTRWVFLQAGIDLPHFSGAQWAGTVHIPLDELQPGDLVFDWGFGGGAPDHVGLYVGDGLMIHAPNGGGSVRYDSIWWWTGATVAAGRLP